MNRFLQWLGGADPAALAQSRSAGTVAAGLGGTVVTTAIMAGGAMAMAMHDWLHLTTAVAVSVGFGWGLAILNLDRWLLSAARRQDSPWLTIALAVPRLLLAIAVGFVIAEPLVLRVFEHEVAAQAVTDRQDKVAAGKTRIEQEYADITGLEAKQARLEATLVGANDAPFAENPDYVEAKDAQDAARDAVARAQIAAGCEAGGTCGTHKAGCGPVCASKLRVLAQRKREANQADAHVRNVQNRLRRQAKHSTRIAKNHARPEVTRVKQELRDLRTRRRHDIEKLEAAFAAPIGLLDREEALSHLSEARPGVKGTTWLLRLFLLAIDITPILFKTLLLLGRKSAVEKVQDEMEDRELGRLQTTQDAEDKAHAIAAGLIVTEAALLNAEQERVIKDMVKEIAAVQRQIWRDQIEAFRSAATAPMPPRLTRPARGHT